MKLPKKMVQGYLNYVTLIELEDVDDPLEDMSVYDTAIVAMAHAARTDGNLDKLQMALDALISTSQSKLNLFQGMGYPFSQDQMVRILEYAFARIWPGLLPSEPGDAFPVEFVLADGSPAT